MSSIISVKNLVKRYRNSPTSSVDDISFSVKRGEFFSLLGPNGAGKTTIISILTTTLSKTSGDCLVAGLDVATQSASVRAKIGIIFQNPSLDKNLTAEENIRFHACLYNLFPYRPLYTQMPDNYKIQVKSLTEVIGLTATDLNKQVKDMSGGMRRKLEIVRSLMHKPEILFLDEPTSGLDPLSRKNLWDYLTHIRKNDRTTIFLTTHYLEEAEDCDNVCIINNGKIVAYGSPGDIKRQYTGHHTTLEQAYLKIIQETN
ncbi:ABC transporter ATP-binding protein [Candidatus Amesbacteria bacterium RIFCSPHIGHO2_01_FULL_48_32]|uniref:ABC transporter ATP-binding protein n=1 Tax=Candidatus Amesbacteria bacterium RIFCSPLOWO2_01_FULL_48_25 TaxID=1797259 RepID=A0A1F4ZBX8_9BACT|nr:MAG: ABC transporter ATP-binding protein [Candidatus Amesbacteria bacterium RIFCSPHIGHO2_01_FULL_48_32]OGD03721.1 MAG: ABC transporter ATP-binding protein [Candidatus Amesbacteria bacterium RIFCSPLOWO2_01_FULL_48_25]HJZ05931.1 ABC transporter ATP-binding protein [Patescibacteria group bacterium]